MGNVGNDLEVPLGKLRKLVERMLRLYRSKVVFLTTGKSEFDSLNNTVSR